MGLHMKLRQAPPKGHPSKNSAFLLFQDRDLAKQLAEATVSGAGALIEKSDEAPDQLRVNVTSKGGTTAAALAVLMADDGMKPLLRRAVLAARDRSIELAG